VWVLCTCMWKSVEDYSIHLQAMEHRESALKLAEHWKMEAERQAAFAQVRMLACMPAKSINNADTQLTALDASHSKPKPCF
jgi:hypothetical protein